jgi:hypothetical protein
MLKGDKKLRAVLDGRVQPAGAEERLALGYLCLNFKRHYATAARLCAEAFAADARLAQNLAAAHRFNAARAAVLASCGAGEDAGNLGPQERAQLRRQALDWLRADLRLCARQDKTSSPRDDVARRQALRKLQEHTDLAGVRDAAALANLPPTERDDWCKFWAEVAAVRQSAQAAP